MFACTLYVIYDTYIVYLQSRCYPWMSNLLIFHVKDKLARTPLNRCRSYCPSSHIIPGNKLLKIHKNNS